MESDQPSEPEWVVIGQYSDEVEAQVVRAFLQGQGIYGFLRDQHTISLNYLYSNALGGVRLVVMASDAPRARQLLLEATNRKFALDESHLPSGLPCPKCSAVKTEIVSQRGRGWAQIILVFLAIPLPFLARDQWKCQSCGHQWRA